MTTTTLTVATIGHVDNGKSSFLSRIVYPEHNGDPNRLDTLDEEKERGMTQEFSTHDIEGITFIDTAGHHGFIRSNIEAYMTIPIDVALIICSLRRGEFLSGFECRNSNDQPPLRDQLLLLRSTGVKRAIIVFTKMDLDTLILEDQANILAPLQAFLKFIQMKTIAVHSVSSKTGQGIEDVLGTIRAMTPSKKVAHSPPVVGSVFTGKCMMLFIPEKRYLMVQSALIVHSLGHEEECVIEKVKSDTPILKMHKEYPIRFRLRRPMPIGHRVILRLAETTVGYCDVVRVSE
jgi:GTP-binding protein EngB required for normal cell division